jgi:hypothetical protein
LSRQTAHNESLSESLVFRPPEASYTFIYARLVVYEPFLKNREIRGFPRFLSRTRVSSTGETRFRLRENARKSCMADEFRKSKYVNLWVRILDFDYVTAPAIYFDKY